jgi:hypothetical protein
MDLCPTARYSATYLEAASHNDELWPGRNSSSRAAWRGISVPSWNSKDRLPDQGLPHTTSGQHFLYVLEDMKYQSSIEIRQDVFRRKSAPKSARLDRADADDGQHGGYTGANGKRFEEKRGGHRHDNGVR